MYCNREREKSSEHAMRLSVTDFNPVLAQKQ